MAFVRGEEGSVKFKNAAGTTAAVASTTGWTLDMTKDTLECTSHGDTARKYVGSLRSGSGTVDLLYTGTSGDETQEFIKDILGDISTVSVSFILNGALTSDGY